MLFLDNNLIYQAINVVQDVKKYFPSQKVNV